MAELTVKGKGIYAWLPWGLGTPEWVANTLVQAGCSHVCFKGHNGYALWESPLPYARAAKAAGLKVGVYGYIYLRYNWAAERDCAARAIDFYQPDYYIIDAEAEAKGYYAAARSFSSGLKNLRPNTPVGLASYRFPSLHRTLPWREFRDNCDFDAPQVYYRNGNAVANLERSIAEFAAMSPRLPFAMPAGDMYLEHGYKPTRSQVRAYLTYVRDHPHIQSTLMWSMDQMVTGKAPELWEEFAAFSWPVNGEPVDPPPVPVDQFYTPCAGATTGALNVRRGPGTSYAVVRTLTQGTVVGLYDIERNWARIHPTNAEWVHTGYLTNAELYPNPQRQPNLLQRAVQALRT